MQAGDAAHEDGWSEFLRGLFSDDTRGGCPVLDEVFAAFFQTNEYREVRLSLDDVLEFTGTCKRHVLFWHADIPYRSIISLRREPEADVVRLQLPNNGFVYKPIGLEADWYSRHGSSTWRSLPASAALRNFPSIGTICPRLYERARVYYNYEEERLDIQLQPTADSRESKPVFQISFEPGLGYETPPWQPIFH